LLIDSIIKELNANYTYGKVKQIKVLTIK
jgi:hypothetical protein